MCGQVSYGGGVTLDSIVSGQETCAHVFEHSIKGIECWMQRVLDEESFQQLVHPDNVVSAITTCKEAAEVPVADDPGSALFVGLFLEGVRLACFGACGRIRDATKVSVYEEVEGEPKDGFEVGYLR